MLYYVYLYCPYSSRFEEFSVAIEAPTEELAKKKVIGKTVTCAGHEFDVEEQFITHIYPAQLFPKPTYKLMPEKRVKEARFLKGAIVDEPLPLGARVKGGPKLATTLKNSVTTLIYEQPIESKAIQFLENYDAFTVKVRGKKVTYGPYFRGDIVYLPVKKAEELVKAEFARWAYPYPEYKWQIRYRRDIFTKFYEEARRMSRAGKIKEATLYLITYCPGVTVRMIADILKRGYWTIYRIVATFVHPRYLEQLSKEVTEQAKLEEWSEGQLEETEKAITHLRYLFEKEKKPPTPKVVIGPLWRGQATLYPIKHKTEKELLAELRRILTLERYKPTEDEWREMEKQMKRQTEAWLKQSILYYLGEKE